jgi:hypothetical protein
MLEYQGPAYARLYLDRLVGDIRRQARREVETI